ncbi:MAG: uL15 family ribosomal protein, partial [Clostridia bacterium]|nr:uL15 family ribosomal protein [Clostridia bacterium]
FDSFDVSGLSLGARYKSGRVVDIPRDELCVSYKNGDGLRFGDNYVTVSYMGVNISHPITVYPAEYDMSGVEFFDEEFIYDGSVHYPTPVGKLPTGVDGSSPSVSFSSGVLNVSEGKVTVTVYFYSESENYANPKPMTVSLCVLPRGVSVSWGEAEHIYSGEPFLPSASCAECEISLSGAGTAVGEYTARAVSLDSNYYVLNGELTFKILKAENSWAEEPSIESIFATGILSPVGKSAFGVTEYLFKSEEEIIEMPRVVGRYYFKAYSSGDENHYAMESEWIEFEIKAVFALDFWVELSRSEFLTLSQISDNDISAFAEYNDGSVKEIPFSEIEIVYNSGDCFSVGDSSVSFRFSELCASGKISVQKRVIGLPEIPSVEYSGKNQAPNEIDLDLFDYEFGEMRDVGKYEITLSVKDTENYEFENGKTQCVALFEIEKRRITVKISDIEKYFFSKESEPGFEVVSGALISGEPLVCEYIVSGEAVNAVFENSNYEVNVIQGKVVEYKRLSPGDSRSAFLLVIIFIFSMLAFVFIYINRKRILEEYREHLSKSDSFIPSMPEAEKSKPSAIEKRKFKSDLSVSGNAEEERAEVIAEKIGEIEFESSEQTVIDAAYADGTITDSLAKDLLRRDIDIITDGRRRRIINIDTLSRSFASGDRIDINILKEKRLIPYDTGYIKVLARGIIDKPLDVYANEFSLTAVKMIVLSGGKAVRVSTQRKN